MKVFTIHLASLLAVAAVASASVRIDDTALGEQLGGWKKRDKGAAEYSLSGATYRTYKPEISPTPDGGLFVSVRIDHVRGWLSSDDHAMLEITVNSKGAIVSAQSTIGIQGRSIASDMIVGLNESGKKLVNTDQAVQIGTDLVANLTSKLLREKVVEAGRVSFPAVIRHNYNLIYQAICRDGEPEPVTPPSEEKKDAVVPAAVPVPGSPAAPTPVPVPSAPVPVPSTPEKAKDVIPAGGVKLDIKPYHGR